MRRPQLRRNHGSQFSTPFSDASSDRLYRYAEWHVGNISAELRSLTYPCCPNEPWPVIAYDVRLTREQTFFVRRASAHPSPPCEAASECMLTARLRLSSRKSNA